MKEFSPEIQKKIDQFHSDLLKNKTEIYQQLKENLTNYDPRLSEEYKNASLTPLFIDKKTYSELAKNCELVFSAIEKLTKHYRVNEELQNYFSEFDAIKDLLMIEPKIGLESPLTRFDLAIDENNKFYLLENNGISSSIFEELISMGALGNISKFDSLINTLFIEPKNLNQIKLIFENLIRSYFESKQKFCNLHILVNNKVKLDSELIAMQNMSKSLLRDSIIVANIADLQIINNKCSVDEKVIDLSLNKFDFDSPDSLFTLDNISNNSNRHRLNSYLQLIKNGHLTLIGSLSANIISSDKKILCLLYNEEYHYLFSTEEIKAIKALMLATYDINDSIHYQSFLKYKDTYVLKYSEGFEGRQVFFGKEYDNDNWETLLNDTKVKNIPAVLQKYVPLKKEKVIICNQDGFFNRATTLCSYIIDGKVIGIGAKSAGKNDSYRTNVTQGGASFNVYLVD